MSRTAVYQALVSDSDLNDMGIGENQVFTNYSMDASPSRHERFLILRWEESRFTPVMRKGPQRVTVWAHSPVQFSSDFVELEKILDRVKEVLTAMEHVDGGDGYTVTHVDFTGSGGDLRDNGYETITKNSAFEVLFRTT